jgi:WD40 repeat protein
LRGHKGSVSSVAWNSDGKRLATGSADGTAKVWDTVTGQELFTLTGHTDAVTSVAWNPDGRRLATGSRDKTAKVSNAGTGEELFTISGYKFYVDGVAWSPDGKWLAIARYDGVVDVDAVDIRDLMALARERVTAHPSEEGCKRYLHTDKCQPVPRLSF